MYSKEERGRMEANPTRTCLRCGEILPKDMFSVNVERPCGRSRYCKKCCSEKARARYLKVGKVEYEYNGYDKVWAKAYYQKTRARHLSYARAYAKEHPEKMKAAKNTPQQRIKTRLAQTIQEALATAKSRRRRGMRSFGCSAPELAAHLEKLFKPGMTWENRGYRGWHVDHIIPAKAFDLTNPEERKKYAHYTNTQPLWAEENMRKHGNYNESIFDKK